MRPPDAVFADPRLADLYDDLDDDRSDLARHGLVVVDVRDAPDRPGLEHVLVCTKPEATVQVQSGPDRG